MQRSQVRFTKSDFAKYPFLKETAEYVKRLDLGIADLTDPSLASVLERAEERVEEAILYTRVSRKPRNIEVEILSFPVAVMIVIATENSFIKKRYALAEAKQAYEDMNLELEEKILAIAQNFGWNLAANSSLSIVAEFSLSFADYIKNTTHLRDKRWKLVNRSISQGNVYLTRTEASRLLSEEIRKHIEKRLEPNGIPKFPRSITAVADKIKKLALERIGEAEIEGYPAEVVQTAFPPCVNALFQAFTSGRHLSHVGRFTLTSFLVNIGMPPEKLIELFKNVSDFNERMTRYQVEHIAGEKGSRTRYIPPKCDTLKTHSVCTNPDDLCKRIRHPLSYYKRKLGTKDSNQQKPPTN